MKDELVYVIDNTFVRALKDGTIVEGDIAVDANGDRICDGVGTQGGVIKRLLDLGYQRWQIQCKRWGSL